MSKKLSLLLAVLLVVSLVAAACGNKKDKKKVELKQTIESSTGVKIRYPDGWAARDSADGIQIANKESYLDLTPGSEFPSDGFGVIILPPVNLETAGLAGSSIKDILTTAAASLTTGSEAATGDVITMKVLGEEAARMGVQDSSNKSEGFIVALKINDNTAIIAMAIAHTGKLKSYEDTAQRMLESITYTAPASAGS
jgi:hypothetical protein